MQLPRRPRNTLLPRAFIYLARRLITPVASRPAIRTHLHVYPASAATSRSCDINRPHCCAASWKIAPRDPRSRLRAWGNKCGRMRRRDYGAVDGGEPDALDWDLDLNLELELRDDQQSRLYRYLSEGHRPRYRNEPPRRAATVTLANRSVRADGFKYPDVSRRVYLSEYYTPVVII